MNTLWHALDMFIAAVFAIFLAFVGSLTRLIHEAAHGEPMSWTRVAFALPGAIVMGVIGTAVGEYLSASWDMPEMTGGALGGALGYLGPSILERLTAAAIARWGQQKPGGP